MLQCGSVQQCGSMSGMQRVGVVRTVDGVHLVHATMCGGSSVLFGSVWQCARHCAASVWQCVCGSAAVCDSVAVCGNARSCVMCM